MEGFMKKVLIIAEIGVNHNKNVDLAKRMILEAKNAGADIAKFQTGVPENVISRFAEKAVYQKLQTGESESQLDMVRKLMFPLETFIELKECCDEIGIQFLSTPFDMESVKFLQSMNTPMWKIPSGEITNLPYLIAIAKTRKPVILSTGMSNLAEIRTAVDILKNNGAGEISVLHCNTEYPTPFEDVNLLAMLTIKKELGLHVGYSDHTPGIEVSIAAAALGAEIIEKHFTLDKNMEGPDHKASLEPQELKAMISAIRNIEKALGSGDKVPSPSEQKNIAIARKSIVAKCDIKKGEIFTEDNITVKRPGNGISPMKWNEILGQTAKRDFAEDELIEHNI
jgi:N,N'-diacetyllegionaminate synthase